MSAPLVPITWPSIYPATGPKKPLPARMAKCTPDMKAAIEAASAALVAKGGKLVLSDLFRSYEMQTQAHQDYVTGRKSAFSPAAGGSLHEAGRAFDLDLGAIKVTLAKFWELAAPAKLVPIIAAPTSGVSESWHFECRGSHQLVYDYYRAGKGNNFPKPYNAMAASAIVSIGVRVDKFGANGEAAYIQSGLIRLGANIGNMDGAIGTKTNTGLAALGIAQGTLAQMVARVEAKLKAKFPAEF
jgi:D-alanyl-D-alanine dipeptidase